MRKVCWSVFGEALSCCNQALLLPELPLVKDWDLSNPYLWGATLSVGNISITHYIGLQISFNICCQYKNVLWVEPLIKRRNWKKLNWNTCNYKTDNNVIIVPNTKIYYVCILIITALPPKNLEKIEKIKGIVEKAQCPFWCLSPKYLQTWSYEALVADSEVLPRQDIMEGLEEELRYHVCTPLNESLTKSLPWEKVMAKTA